MLRDISRALSREWTAINRNVFGGALLLAPTIEISERFTSTLGQWNPTERALRFSQKFVAEHPWWVVVEVLKHEMAHQYVSDVLGVAGEETSHGPAFRMVCDRYGIDGRAGHQPTEEERRVVERARKLLALASSSNEHEARNALAAARRLLGHHGLEEEDTHGTDHLLGAMVVGKILAKRSLVHRLAATVLTSHFHVRAIWMNVRDPRTDEEGVQLEIMGRRSDIAMATYVHDWLLGTAARLCPSGLGAKGREDFQAGVVLGHFEHLNQEAASARAASSDASTSLVVTKRLDTALDDYFARRHPDVRRLRGRRRSLSSSFREGQATGRALKMSKPLDEGTGIKLLKGGS